jgi:hypothetical protein
LGSIGQVENIGFFDTDPWKELGASPQTPEVFSGMAPVFNGFTCKLYGSSIAVLGETDQSSAEMQLCEG